MQKVPMPRYLRIHGFIGIAAALILGGCGVNPQPERPTSTAAEESPVQEVQCAMHAVVGGLAVKVAQARPGVFRFDVGPATEAIHEERTLDVVSLDAASGRFSLKDRDGHPWVCQITKLEKFGRAGVPGLEVSWSSREGESLYGLGERFDGLDQVGKAVDMWIEDAPGQGDAGLQSYYVTPVLYSTRGYAFFAAQNPEGSFDLNSKGDGFHHYQRAGQVMTFYVAFGDSLKELVGKRESVQGPHRSIPDWAWGPWISRNSFENQAEAEEAINGMVQRGLPVAAIVQEAWKGSSEVGNFNNFDPGRWPDLSRFFDLCNRHDIKNVLWQVPVIHPSSPEFAIGKEKGYFVKKQDGSISFRQNWLKDFANIDFTNPDAVKFWQDLIRPTLKLGVWGFKADDGEDIKPDDLFSDGRRGWEMHNEYSTLYNRALTELMKQEGVDGLLWARSGSLGNEQYPALWAGDQYARWGQLASLVPAGLSASMSGMPFWGHDIGGYMEQPTPELYIRWVQFGALSPLMQYHGVLRREPWEFGPKAEAAYRLLVNLRMNLKPALIELGREVEKTGLPIMRPMVMEFPGDPRFPGMDDQYMLGSDMLVAPVLREGATGRRVEFPEGVWHHALYPIAFVGPASIDVPVGLIDAPLFFREGATPKLQLAEGTDLGAWSADAPLREVKIASDRAAILNLKAPPLGNPLARSMQIEFDLAPGVVAGGISVYWYFGDDDGVRTPAVVSSKGSHVTVDITPPLKENLSDRLQTYVIEIVDGALVRRELFRGSLRWRSPVTLQVNRETIGVAYGGQTSLKVCLVNSSDVAVDVGVKAEAGAGTQVDGALRAVVVPARGGAEMDWDIRFDRLDVVGDSRVRFSVGSGGTLLDRKVVPFVRSPRWVVAGPFPAAYRKAYSTSFAPERSLSPDVAFDTADGRVVWRQVDEGHVERYAGLDFNELFGKRGQAAAYAMTKIISDSAKPVELRFGSDDTLTVWLNGERIYSVEAYRLAAPDQEIVKATLRPGNNTLLVKVAQDENPWKLYFRITAPDGLPVTGLRDGFTDYAAFAPGRTITRSLPATQ